MGRPAPTCYRGEREQKGDFGGVNRCAAIPHARVSNERPMGRPCIAAQPDAQNLTQLAPRSGTKEGGPRKVKTYLIRLQDTPQAPPAPPQFFSNTPNNRPRARTSTSGARINARPFSSLLSASKSTAACKPSYNVLSIRNVTRPTGWLGANSATMPGLASSVVRWGTAVESNSPAPSVTPTKFGRAMWMICGRAGGLRGTVRRTQRGACLQGA